MNIQNYINYCMYKFKIIQVETIPSFRMDTMRTILSCLVRSAIACIAIVDTCVAKLNASQINQGMAHQDCS